MGNDKAKAIDALFDSWGNNVHTEEFGDIALTKSSRRNDLKKGSTYLKNEAYLAIPAVLQKGKLIDSYFEKGNKNSDRLLIAAPIEIETKPFYMGIFVKRSAHSQQLYAHEVVMIKKEEAAPASQEHLNTTGSRSEGNKLSFNILLHNLLNVKQNQSKKLVLDRDYMEAARHGDEEKAPECYEQAEPILKKEKEVDVMGDTSLEKDQTDLLSTSTYSIREVFKNINLIDKLLKVCVGFRCKATEYHESRYLSKKFIIRLLVPFRFIAFTNASVIIIMVLKAKRMQRAFSPFMRGWIQ